MLSLRPSLLLLGIFPALVVAFDPTAYARSNATCKATKRDTDHEVDISLSYIDINPTAETTLILVHGWPSIWSTWARQITEFEKDYHLIVPDLRGFGRSTHPDDVRSSGTLFDHVGDLTCILEHANVKEAVCVGHDWGSAVCYEAGRSRPDIFKGIVGGVVPYIPAGPDFLATRMMPSISAKLAYQIYFDEKTDDAVKELDADIRRSLRSTLRAKSSPPPDAFLKSTESFIGAWSDHDEIPPIPWFSPEEEDYIVQEFSVQGYRNTLQFYTTENRKLSWQRVRDQGNATLPQPVLALYPTHDPVADWEQAALMLKSAAFLPDLETVTMPGSHWVHLENADDFNRALRKWLDSKFQVKHDEL